MLNPVSFLTRLGSKILGISATDPGAGRTSEKTTPKKKGHSSEDGYARVTEPSDPQARIAIAASHGRVKNGDDALARVVTLVQGNPSRLWFVAQYINRYSPAEVQKNGFVKDIQEYDGQFLVTLNTYGVVKPYAEFVVEAATGQVTGIYELDLYRRRCSSNMA